MSPLRILTYSNGLVYHIFLFSAFELTYPEVI